MQNKESKYTRQQIEFLEDLDNLAKAAGIQIGRKSWWELTTAQKVDKLTKKVNDLNRKVKGIIK